MSRPDDTELLTVITTVATDEQAAVLADEAIAGRLAACVHAEPIRSTYRWEGSVVREPEVRLLFKTTKARWPALRDLLLASHPYELPAIVALPVTAASTGTVSWVEEQTRDPNGPGAA